MQANPNQCENKECIAVVGVLKTDHGDRLILSKPSNMSGDIIWLFRDDWLQRNIVSLQGKELSLIVTPVPACSFGLNWPCTSLGEDGVAYEIVSH